MIVPHLSAIATRGRPTWLLAALAGGCVLVCTPGLRADPAHPAPGLQPGPSASAVSGGSAAPLIQRSQGGATYYARRFGVDQMRVIYTASGSELEFRYRVIDPDKAAVLSDKRLAPYLIDERSGIRLMVPVVEQVGALRTTGTPERGREYFMLFGNAGKTVKPGARVDVSIGTFQVRGLTVE
jgi:hypothetical protein